jgi:hypothetical protein
MNSGRSKLSAQARHFKPFISVCFIIFTLFTLVFLKMEERRMSYAVLKLTREFKKVAELKKQKEIQLVKLSRPQFVENIAKGKLTLKRATDKQIIHLSTIVATK